MDRNNGQSGDAKDDTVADNVTLPLIRRGKITLAEALEEEDNMLLPLSFPKQRVDLFVDIESCRSDLANLVAHDLGLRSGETCELSHPREWIHGSFNVCVPIDTYSWKRHPGKRVLLRLPLPYKTGELHRPGNVDEKLRTEAATYLWIQRNCPDVPIPFLWSFGLGGGQSFLRLENAPFTARLQWYCQRILNFLTGRCSAPQHPYVPVKRTIAAEKGYLIMDYIQSENESMLSEMWSAGSKDPRLRKNLFRGLARVMLSLGRVPMPRIGSWTIDDEGTLSLTNRPLLHHLHSLENGGIPIGIPRTRTYETTDAFYMDLLSCHDSRILHQPNSILSENDGSSQMACLFAMRGLLRNFADPNLRYGPFHFALTDLHASNIFVDKEWNIKHLIDLEWACALPLEMQGPPYWLSEQPDEEEGLEEFDRLRQEFMQMFKDEEQTQGHATLQTDLMDNGWRSGRFWYLHALLSPKACHNLFNGRIRPMFAPDVTIEKLGPYLGPFWCRNALKVVEEKLGDKEKYELQLRELFARPPEDDYPS